MNKNITLKGQKISLTSLKTKYSSSKRVYYRQSNEKTELIKISITNYSDIYKKQKKRKEKAENTINKSKQFINDTKNQKKTEKASKKEQKGINNLNKQVEKNIIKNDKLKKKINKLEAKNSVLQNKYRNMKYVKNAFIQPATSGVIRTSYVFDKNNADQNLGVKAYTMSSKFISHRISSFARKKTNKYLKKSSKTTKKINKKSYKINRNNYISKKLTNKQKQKNFIRRNMIKTRYKAQFKLKTIWENVKRWFNNLKITKFSKKIVQILSVLASSVLLQMIIAFVVVIVIVVYSILNNQKEINLGSASSNGTISQEVLTYKPTVEEYAKLYRIENYVDVLLAIMQTESGGKGNDPMQASESKGLAPNTIDNPVESIKAGIEHFYNCLEKANEKKIDISAVIQSYNYGSGFLDFVFERGGKYTLDIAVEFAKNMSNGVMVDYKNEVAKEYDYKRYAYGNMFYVKVVNSYLNINKSADALSPEYANALLNEAEKHMGKRYVFGSNGPNTFDCSGFVSWVFKHSGVKPKMKRDTAQGFYNKSVHLQNFEQVRPGDLVFYEKTYETDREITHIGIYAGNNKVYHCGNPCQLSDLNNKWHQKHLHSFGRLR